MRKSSFLLALLLLALAPPNAQGRVLKASTAHTGPPTATGSPSLSSSALPPTTAAGPSPLLNAPPVASWQPVPGAQPVTADGTQRSPDMQPRIIDGDTDAQAALFPYAAFVQWRVNATASFRCSGSLVGPSHVLTAAHVS
jgi:V8-like Glu-specific endopeptidase